MTALANRPRCPTPEKVLYVTESAARATAFLRHPDQEPYRCRCMGWHLAVTAKRVEKQRQMRRLRDRGKYGRKQRRSLAAATESGSPWPAEAVADLVAGVSANEVAKRYGRTFAAARNKRKALRGAGLISTGEES